MGYDETTSVILGVSASHAELYDDQEARSHTACPKHGVGQGTENSYCPECGFKQKSVEMVCNPRFKQYVVENGLGIAYRYKLEAAKIPTKDLPPFPFGGDGKYALIVVGGHTYDFIDGEDDDDPAYVGIKLFENNRLGRGGLGHCEFPVVPPEVVAAMQAELAEAGFKGQVAYHLVVRAG